MLSLVSLLGIVAASMLPRPAPAPREAAAALLLTMLRRAGIFVLLYLQYNAMGARSIDGLQGRYVLPLVVTAAPWLPRVRGRAAAMLPAIATGATLVCALHLVARIPRWWTA